MSHANGEVITRSSNRVLAHFEYNGTSDVAISCLHDTYASMSAEWRAHHWRDCRCGAPSIGVYLWTDYGGDDGFYWPASICLDCRAITANLAPHLGEEEDPFSEWPKDGYPLRIIDVQAIQTRKLLS